MTSMRSITSASLLLLSLTPACMTPQAAQVEGGRASELPEAHESPSYSYSEDSAAPSDAVAAPSAKYGHGLGSDQVTLWNDPEFRQQFAESYLAVNDIEPPVTLDERDVLQDVAEWLSKDRTDKAVSLLKEMSGPQATAVFDFTLGNIHFQNEQLEAAAEAYELAVAKHRKFRRAWKNLGLVRARLEDYRAGVRPLTHVVELGGGDSMTYGLLGFCYSKLEKPLAAESAYRMAALLEADNTDWQLGLARSFFDQQRYPDAVTLCSGLIDEQPDSADLWLLQANAYVGMGQPMRAAQNFEFVERLGKSTATSLNSLGDIYVNEKLFELAVDSYVRALERDDQIDASRALRATRSITANGALDEAGRLIEAVARLRGESMATDDRKLLLKLEARVAVARGENGEQARILEEIVAIDPLDGEALILLGEHAGRVDQPEEAVFYFERAANIDGFEGQAKRRHGQLLVKLGRYAEALPFLRRAQMLEPSSALEDYIAQVERVAR